MAVWRKQFTDEDRQSMCEGESINELSKGGDNHIASGVDKRITDYPASASWYVKIISQEQTTETLMKNT